MAHPDLAAERAHLAHARRCLASMRARTEDLLARPVLGGDAEGDELARYHLTTRLASMDDPASLCFGRIDEGDGRPADPTVEKLYIGRRHVEDELGDPVVIDWRARAAVPFYRATLADPMGLVRRRRFAFDGPDLADLVEEDFEHPEEGDTVSTGGIPDPLLAELGRARTGRMRDIVATIQAEQDEVIRAGIDECLVVQGGPGTGKTAVGLHRVAYLLYEHRERLLRDGVLVLGPNRVFLSYIADVLPSLGETAVTQATVDAMLGRFRRHGPDPAEVAAVKGDRRMVEVIARAAGAAAIRLPEDRLEIAVGTRVVRVDPGTVAAMVGRARQRDAPMNVQRTSFQQMFWRHVHQRLGETGTSRGDRLGSPEEVGRRARASGDGPRRLDGVWRPVNPVAIVRSVLTSRTGLARAAEGVLSDREQRLILRSRTPRGAPETWAPEDLPLLDEAEALANGTTRRYGHIVVDEAQDLSPMGWRLVGRRSLRGSLTVLGDLAQATAPASIGAWDEVLDHLGRPVGARTVELTVGYRLPAAILEVANRLLDEAAPSVAPAVSAREEGQPPRFAPCAAADRASLVATETTTLAGRSATTAVICPPDLAREVVVALDAMLGTSVAADPGADADGGPRPAATPADEESGDLAWSRRWPARPGRGEVRIVSPILAKGLEFDGVVVVEPAAVVDRPGVGGDAAGPRQVGFRALFVALTRAVQELVVVHARPLPPPLGEPDRPPGPGRDGADSNPAPEA